MSASLAALTRAVGRLRELADAGTAARQAWTGNRPAEYPAADLAAPIGRWFGSRRRWRASQGEERGGLGARLPRRRTYARDSAGGDPLTRPGVPTGCRSAVLLPA